VDLKSRLEINVWLYQGIWL